MTTGRINQVAIVRPGGLLPLNFHVARREPRLRDVQLRQSYVSPTRYPRRVETLSPRPGAARAGSPVPLHAHVRSQRSSNIASFGSFRRETSFEEAGTKPPESAPSNVPFRESTVQDCQANNRVRRDRRDPQDHQHLWTAFAGPHAEEPSQPGSR